MDFSSRKKEAQGRTVLSRYVDMTLDIIPVFIIVIRAQGLQASHSRHKRAYVCVPVGDAFERRHAVYGDEARA